MEGPYLRTNFIQERRIIPFRRNLYSPYRKSYPRRFSVLRCRVIHPLVVSLNSTERRVALGSGSDGRNLLVFTLGYSPPTMVNFQMDGTVPLLTRSLLSSIGSNVFLPRRSESSLCPNEKAGTRFQGEGSLLLGSTRCGRSAR